MNMQTRWVSIIAAAAVALSMNATAAPRMKAPVLVNSEQTEFKEVVPGVSKKVLWGNHDAGPYGAFTKFDPGLSNPMHTHTHEVRIVVLKGAYIYTPKNGSEQRVTAGSYISIPAGDVHTSGADAAEGALFYEESTGKFDIKMVDQKGKK